MAFQACAISTNINIIDERTVLSRATNRMERATVVEMFPSVPISLIHPQNSIVAKPPQL